jgi:hypothetical protein
VIFWWLHDFFYRSLHGFLRRCWFAHGKLTRLSLTNKIIKPLKAFFSKTFKSVSHFCISCASVFDFSGWNHTTQCTRGLHNLECSWLETPAVSWPNQHACLDWNNNTWAGEQKPSRKSHVVFFYWQKTTLGLDRWWTDDHLQELARWWPHIEGNFQFMRFHFASQ